MPTLLLILALAGVAATVAALVTLHALPSGLSPVRDAVSAYGISRYRGLYRAQTIGTAVAAGALAVALPAAADATPAVISLAVLAAARLIISWFPMDAPGAARTPTGRIHNLLAFGAFAAASVSGFMVGIAFSGEERLAPFADAASWFGWAMSAASALTILAVLVRSLRPVFGLAERLIYVAMLAFLAFAAVVLITV